jgi:hypothetical protein
MFKRVMMIGLVALSVVLMLGIEGKAQSLWNVQFFWGSIDCASILNGLSKKAAASTLVECEVLVKEVSFVCRNPRGNPDQSTSHLFQPQNALVTALTVVTECILDKQTGKWHCDQTISDAQIQNALEQDPSLADACPSGNWTLQLDVVSKMEGKVTVFACKDTFGNACQPNTAGCSCTSPPGTVQDTFCGDCVLPGGVAGQYSCTELPLATCSVP